MSSATHREYFGYVISPPVLSPRHTNRWWSAYVNGRSLRADTLEGIKRLVREHK